MRLSTLPWSRSQGRLELSWCWLAGLVPMPWLRMCPSLMDGRWVSYLILSLQILCVHDSVGLSVKFKSFHDRETGHSNLAPLSLALTLSNLSLYTDGSIFPTRYITMHSLLVRTGTHFESMYYIEWLLWEIERDGVIDHAWCSPCNWDWHHCNNSTQDRALSWGTW